MLPHNHLFSPGGSLGKSTMMIDTALAIAAAPVAKTARMVVGTHLVEVFGLSSSFASSSRGQDHHNNGGGAVFVCMHGVHVYFE